MKRARNSRAPRVGTGVLRDVSGPGPSPGSYSISPAGRSTSPPQVPPAVWHSQSTLEAGQEPLRPGPSPLSPGTAVQSADRAAPTKPIPRHGTPELKGGRGGAAPISFRPTAAAGGGPQHRLPETTLEQVTVSLLLQNRTAAVGGSPQHKFPETTLERITGSLLLQKLYKSSTSAFMHV